MFPPCFSCGLELEGIGLKTTNEIEKYFLETRRSFFGYRKKINDDAITGGV